MTAHDANSPSKVVGIPFQPGQDARRTGRKAGSRQKLASAFVNDLYALWEEQGEAVLRRMAFHDPAKFAEMVAKLMPQRIEIETPTTGMSLERLAEMVELAERMIALRQQAQGLDASQPDSSDHSLSDAPMRIEGAPAGFIEGEVIEGERGVGGRSDLRSGGGGTGTSSTPAPLEPNSPITSGGFPHKAPVMDKPTSPITSGGFSYSGPPPIDADDPDFVDPASLF